MNIIKTKHLIFCKFILTASLFQIANSNAESLNNRVYWIGEQRQVVKFDDLTDRVSIQELSKTSPLYGIGPVSKLQGEITVVDGQCFISDWVNGKEVVTKDCSKKAPFFVYGYFPESVQVKLPGFNNLKPLSKTSKVLLKRQIF